VARLANKRLNLMKPNRGCAAIDRLHRLAVERSTAHDAASSMAASEAQSDVVRAARSAFGRAVRAATVIRITLNSATDLIAACGQPSTQDDGVRARQR